MSTAGIKRGFLGARPPGNPASKQRGPAPTTASDTEPSSSNSSSTSDSLCGTRAAVAAAGQDEASKADFLKLVAEEAAKAQDDDARLAATVTLLAHLPCGEPECLKAVFDHIGGLRFLHDLLVPIMNPGVALSKAPAEEFAKAFHSVAVGLQLMAALVMAPRIAANEGLRAFLSPLQNVVLHQGLLGMSRQTPDDLCLELRTLHRVNAEIVVQATSCLTALFKHHPGCYNASTHRACLPAISGFVLSSEEPGVWVIHLLQLLRQLLALAGPHGTPGREKFAFERLDDDAQHLLTTLACWLATKLGHPDLLMKDPKQANLVQAALRAQARQALPCLLRLLQYGGPNLLQLLEALSNSRPSEWEEGREWLPRAISGVCWAMLEIPGSDAAGVRQDALELVAVLLRAVGPGALLLPVALVSKAGERTSKLAAELIITVVVIEYKVILWDFANPDSSSAFEPRTGATEAAAMLGQRTLQRLQTLEVICEGVCDAWPQCYHELPLDRSEDLLQRMGALASACAEAVCAQLPRLAPAEQQRLLQAVEDGERADALCAAIRAGSGGSAAALLHPVILTLGELGRVVALQPEAPAVALLRQAADMEEGGLMQAVMPGVLEFLLHTSAERRVVWLDTMAELPVLQAVATMLQQEADSLRERTVTLRELQREARLPSGHSTLVPTPKSAPEGSTLQALMQEEQFLQEEHHVVQAQTERLMLGLELVLERICECWRLAAGADKVGGAVEICLDIAGRVGQWGHTHQMAMGVRACDDPPVADVLRAMPQHEMLPLTAANLVGKVLLVAVELLDVGVGHGGEGEGPGRGQAGVPEGADGLPVGAPAVGAAARGLDGVMPMIDLEACCGLVLWGVQLGLAQVADLEQWARLQGEEGGADPEPGAVAHWSQHLNAQLPEAFQERMDQLLGTATLLVQREPWLLKQACAAQWLQNMAPTLLALQLHQQQPLHRLQRVSDCILQAGVEVTGLQAFVRACMECVSDQGLTELD